MDTRTLARNAVIETIDPQVYKSNLAFIEKLQGQIKSHRLTDHPIMTAMSQGTFNNDQMAAFHLEFFHAFAQVFTDAVVEGLSAAKELDNRLGAKAKAAARVLLQINLLDELGFKPGIDDCESYRGDSGLSHYVQYFEAMSELALTESDIKSYQPMTSSVACRATFENCYGNYTHLMVLLAVAETVFHDYAGPWARNVGMTTDIDVTKGYHSIHVEDDSGVSIEDGHSDDAWILVNQAITEDHYEEISRMVTLWLNVWTSFCDDLVGNRYKD